MLFERMLKGIGLSALGAMFLLTGPAQTASADTVYTWATNVEEMHQGNRADNSPVASNRSNPANALGAPDASAINGVNFYSLGLGGDITFSFGVDFTKESVVLYEITNGGRESYPESIELYVSKTLNPGDFIKVTSLTNGQGEIKLFDYVDAAGPFRYLKLVDTTARDYFWNGQTGRDRYADGFDINAVGVTAVADVTAVPLPAAGWAGLSLLGGLGVAKWRRMRNA